MRKLPVPLLSPFFLAIYPILFFYGNNLQKVDFKDMVITIIASLLLTLILLILNRWIFKELQRTLFVTSLILLLFFTYGHVFELFRTLRFTDGLPFGRTPWLYGLWGLLLLAGLWFAIKKQEHLLSVNRYIGVFFGLLLAASVLNTTFNILTYRDEISDSDTTITVTTPQVLPDIYYIIIDQYAGDSTLLGTLGYDNSAFTDSLQERGFYIANEARSNYYTTITSLASSLNMEYLDFLTEEPDPEATSIALVRNNLTVRTLKQLGYTYILFTSEYPVTQDSPWADIAYMGFKERNKDQPQLSLFPLNNYYLSFGTTTLLRPFIVLSQSLDKRGRHFFYLEKLSEISTMPESTFTFAHLTLTHEPYVFTIDDGTLNPNGRQVDGRIIDTQKYEMDTEYIDQFIFTNRAISELVDTILEQSSTEPIILIQGDHGFRQLCSDCYSESKNWEDTMYSDVILPILNAYYLPNGGDAQLYANISPVNSFRLIFDYYFGTELGLVEDRYFRAPDYSQMYNFVDITTKISD